MDKEHKEFLQNLQTELNTQPNDYNASPVFWVIMDYKWKNCNTDFEETERMYVYDNEAAWGDEIEKFIKQFISEEDSLSDEIKDEGLLIVENGDWSDMEMWLIDNSESSLTFIPQQRQCDVAENTMFITKASAQEHLELNAYHYSEDAHTYAMTAWRSPVVEKLWEVLRTADFGKKE